MILFEIFEMTIFYYTGLVYLTYLVGNICLAIAIQTHRKYISINWLEKFGEGSYALITGPTSGIGLQMAYSLCQKGFNLVLVGRSEIKLASMKEYLIKLHPERSIVTIKKDFANSMDENFYKDVAERTDKLDVSLVINNAGIGYNEDNCHDLNIEQKPISQILEMINVNITSYIMNHLHFYPRFQKRAQHSGFVDVSSLNAVTLWPIFNVYGCTKAFIRYLSNSLANANSNPLVHHFCYLAGLVETKMMKTGTRYLKFKPFLAIDARTSADCALNCLGVINEGSAYFKHEIIRTINMILLHLNRTIVQDLLNFFIKRKMHA
jgi:short-subunit dehydrogenase